MNGIITAKEAAERLHVSVRRVQNLIAAKRLPAEKIGNSYAIKVADLKFVKQRKNGRPSEKHVPREKDWSAIIDRFSGCLTTGPSDLSTNKKHLNDYGRKPYMKNAAK